MYTSLYSRKIHSYVEFMLIITEVVRRERFFKFLASQNAMLKFAPNCLVICMYAAFSYRIFSDVH